jgi:hypothetical protein
VFKLQYHQKKKIIFQVKGTSREKAESSEGRGAHRWGKCGCSRGWDKGQRQKLVLVGALVHSGFQNKGPQTGWLIYNGSGGWKSEMRVQAWLTVHFWLGPLPVVDC